MNMFAKTVECACLGAVALGVMAADAIPPSWVSGVSAFGLIGFMVAQNYGQQKRLGRVVDKKDARIKELSERHEQAFRANTEAYEKLIRTLEQRPCLIDKEPSVRT